MAHGIGHGTTAWKRAVFPFGFSCRDSGQSTGRDMRSEPSSNPGSSINACASRVRVKSDGRQNQKSADFFPWIPAGESQSEIQFLRPVSSEGAIARRVFRRQ